MKKALILLSCASLALVGVGCQKTAQTDGPDPGVEQKEDVAVVFGAYVNRSTTTKAGFEGTLTTDALKTAASGGFGVFGYYTNDEPYSPSAKPDFMYNQQVRFTGSAWDYAPIKYWPNNYGAEAQSDAIDRLSFFAYAPYADVTYSTGLVSDGSLTGITALTRNTAAGDPLVKYAVSMDPATSVDLCWGVSAGDFTSSVDGNNNTVEAGQPFLNLIKPKTGDRLSFNFKHALAALNVRVDTDIDVVHHDDSGDLDAETRIYVRSVTFEGFTTKGALNLNNGTWYDLAGTSLPDKGQVTVYDGRRDGREGVASAAATNETPVGLNPVLVQSVPYYTVDGEGNTIANPSLSEGVTHTAVNLFNGEDIDTPVLVIPNNASMKVTIVYDVETKDDHLATTLADRETRGSSIENNITKSVMIGTDDLALVAGKKYTLNLHLGMTSVKMEATVSDWDNGSEADVDMPVNSSTTATITVGGVTVDPGTGTGI